MEPVVSKDKTDATIQLVIDPALTVKAEGGYRIEVANNKIVLTAKDNLGILLRITNCSAIDYVAGQFICGT